MLADLPKSTYCYTNKVFNRPNKNQELIDNIKDIFEENKQRYGYRRITLQLANMGFKVNHKKVKRIMKEEGLFGGQPKAKYKSYKGAIGKVANNHLLNKIVDVQNCKTYYERNFNTSGPNQKWTTDVTEFHIAAGKLYLSPIMDLYNREIVSFNISKTPNFNQTLDMLNKAFKKNHNLIGLIFHSDQGWQYQMTAYQKKLRDKGIIQSMSRKGNCLDNSLMENFFGIMKNEMFYGHEYEFKTLQDLENAITQYIEYYNNKRISVKNKGLSPIAFRKQSFV